METQIPKLTIEDNTQCKDDAAETSEAIVEKLASLRVLNSELLPIDLIVEILKRLPVKTLARFLSVSKVWGSIIRSRNFKKLFLAESSNRPGRLFFTFRRIEFYRFFFSSNLGESTTYHMADPVCETTIKSSSCLHDLICYETHSSSELVVYNSTTKRSITLPSLEFGSLIVQHFLGYDPVDAVYKVMCMCFPSRSVFQVMTLGNGNEWRMVECPRGHLPSNKHICIDGILYYSAYADISFVVSFDVRSEKFDLINGPIAPDFPADRFSTMTCYEGKLAFISFQVSADGSMVLWVLEDATKHEWLKKVFVLPNSWTSLASPPLHDLHHFLSITVAGEFILVPLSTSVPPLYVLYYDPKRNSVRKVSIEGIMEHELLQWNEEEPWFIHHVFSSEVESLMFW